LHLGTVLRTKSHPDPRPAATGQPQSYGLSAPLSDRWLRATLADDGAPQRLEALRRGVLGRTTAARLRRATFARTTASERSARDLWRSDNGEPPAASR